MAYNLDHLDTDIPIGGTPIELRGQKFMLRKATVADAFDKTVKSRGWESEEELRDFLRKRLFATQKEFDRFWKCVTNDFQHDDPEQSKAAMGMNEIIPLTTHMLAVANGIATEVEDPKE